MSPLARERGGGQARERERGRERERERERIGDGGLLESHERVRQKSKVMYTRTANGH